MELVTGWRPIFNAISTHIFFPGIIHEGEGKDLGKLFRIVKIYGSYGETIPFRDQLKE
jgi:hypothetical protein